LRIATRDFNSFFLGAIREVRVWNRALTASEVQLVYANTIPQDGLVAEYRLDYGIAPDTVGLHDGQIIGGETPGPGSFKLVYSPRLSASTRGCSHVCFATHKSTNQSRRSTGH
jgi:hypothetical protein